MEIIFFLKGQPNLFVSVYLSKDKVKFCSFIDFEDLDDVTTYFCDNIEQAEVTHIDKRIEAAKKIYKEFVY